LAPYSTVLCQLLEKTPPVMHILSGSNQEEDVGIEGVEGIIGRKSLISV